MELIAQEIRKRFGAQTALDGVSLTAGPGVLAVLGPNGSGKTTLLRILATILRPDGGSAAFGGRAYAVDPRPVRQVLGYVPQHLDLPDHLTPWALLRYIAQLKGMPAEPQSGRLLQALGLETQADTRLAELSGGQIRRAGIAQALLGNPRLLVLDEPTAGLDPEERDRVLRLVAAPGTGRTVIMSTHRPGEAEAIARHVLILHRGRMLFSGTADKLRGQSAGCVFEAAVPADQVEAYVSQYTVSRITAGGDCAVLRIVGDPPKGLAAVPVPGTLEDAYLLLADRQNQVARPGV